MNFSNITMSKRIRRTPYTDKIEECGVTGFTVVNHMLLPKAFSRSTEEDYWHLASHVQLWDVSCQRQVQIEGPDSDKFIQMMTPRSIKDMHIGQCLYIPLIDENAGMINDPVLLKLDNKKFWLSIADSDVLLWAKGLAVGLNLNVSILEPEIYPLAIQGPKSEDLMVSVFGEEIKSIKFFNFKVFDFNGEQQIISRSGYSNQDGFEIFFSGYDNGELIWEKLWQHGLKYNISAGCPNLIDRIEAGLLSYGNDFTIKNNPMECNFENYIKDLNHEFIGKKALEKIKLKGVTKKIRGIIFDESPCPSCTIPFPVFSKNKLKIGEITSGIYSPKLKKNIGISMILREYSDVETEVIIETPDKIKRYGVINLLPFTK